MPISIGSCSLGNETPPCGEFILKACEMVTTPKGFISIKMRFDPTINAKQMRDVTLNINDGFNKTIQVNGESVTFIPGEVIGRALLVAMGEDHESCTDMLSVGQALKSCIGLVMQVDSRPIEVTFDWTDQEGNTREGRSVNFSRRGKSLASAEVFNAIQDIEDYNKFAGWLEDNFKPVSQDVQNAVDDDLSKQEDIVHDDNSVPSVLGEGKLYTR
jgi:hypothetical protein